jgi:hypothetical protein
MYQYQTQIWIFKAPKDWIRQRHHHTQYKMLQGCLVYHGISFSRKYAPNTKTGKNSREKFQFIKFSMVLSQKIEFGRISS